MVLLSVEDLRKSYPSADGGRRLVIDVPSFELEAGRELALRGPSGSGKTTFLSLLAGISRADSGRIRIDGTELTSLSESGRDRLRARSIGYVFQQFQLLQGYSALENVLLAMRFGAGADRERARLLLERTGLGDRLRERPRELSVGQQQRVAVARALANRPRLVLADEPTGNLDPDAAREAIGLIREVCAESRAALLLVSHDREVLAGFDTVRELADVNRAARSSGSGEPGVSRGARHPAGGSSRSDATASERGGAD